MGNAIAKKFDLPKEHTATVGHVSNWKIWPGKSKENGKLVSIWAFDKADLTKRKVNPVSDKAVVEQIFQIMKRDFATIKESKDCSTIIQPIEVVEDSKTCIAFSTERIVCSLADILNNFENVPGGIAEHANFFEAGTGVSEMEISRGLLHIGQAVQYLHTVQRKLHLNITPESIVITAAGQWKLIGFGFSLGFSQGEQQRLASPYFLQQVDPKVVSTVTRLEPDLRYGGPELTDGGVNPPGVRYLTGVADMFSLGVLFYEVYRYNLKYTSQERGDYHAPIVKVTNNDPLQHHSALANLSGTDFSFLPGGIVQILSGMMQMNTQIRSSIGELVNNAYFVTGAQATLNMIDSIASRDLGTQSSQLISLQSDLGSFPARILIHAVLPTISQLCLTSPNMWVYCLPLHAEISKLIPSDKYVHFALPYLAEGLADTNCPTETLQMFLSSMEFLCRTFGAEFFQAHVANLLCTAMERQNLFLQNLALEKMAEEYVYNLFSGPTLVEKLMPQLCKEACKNPEWEIKAQSLYIISLVTWKLDEFYIANNVLTSLKYITDNEKNSAVAMCVVGNFESISNSLGLEYVALHILPILQALLLDPGLDKNQFELVVNMVKRLLKKILDQRTTELQMAPISVAEVPGSEVVDPFAVAKSLIQANKERNAANNYGMVTGSYTAFSPGIKSQYASQNNNNAAGSSSSSEYDFSAHYVAQNAAVTGATMSMYNSSNSNINNNNGGGSSGIGAGFAGSASTSLNAGLSIPGNTNSSSISSSSSSSINSALPKVPPPLPSAPPPSAPPPPVPTTSGSAGTSTAGSTNSSVNFNSSSYVTANKPMSTSVASGMTGNSGGMMQNSHNPSLSTFQSSFGPTASASGSGLSSSNNNSNSATTNSSIGVGAAGIGGGQPIMPGYGATTNSSSSSDTEKRSSWNIFSSKSKAPLAAEEVPVGGGGRGRGGGGGGGGGSSGYQPPSVPFGASSNNGGMGGMGGNGAGINSTSSSSSSGMGGMGSSTLITASAGDFDAFDAAFSGTAPTATTSSSAAGASAGNSSLVQLTPSGAYPAPAGAKALGYTSSMGNNVMNQGYNHGVGSGGGSNGMPMGGGISAIASGPKVRSSFSASGGSYNVAPVAAAPPQTQPTAMSASSGYTIDQQIAMTQQEVNRLSLAQQQQQQQQKFYGSHNATTGYAPPGQHLPQQQQQQQQQQAYPQYGQQQQQQPQSIMMPMYGTGAGMGGGQQMGAYTGNNNGMAAAAGGYQPPGPLGQQQQQQQQRPNANATFNDPFDFLK